MRPCLLANVKKIVNDKHSSLIYNQRQRQRKKVFKRLKKIGIFFFGPLLPLFSHHLFNGF
jgi:hypothetical protein